MNSVPAVRSLRPALVLQPTLVLLFAVMTAYLIGAQTGPVRQLVVSLFTLLGPGLALTQWFKVRSHLYEGVLAVGLSLAVATLLAVVMVYTGTWSPERGMQLLAVLCALGCAARLYLLLRPSDVRPSDLRYSDLRPTEPSGENEKVSA